MGTCRSRVGAIGGGVGNGSQRRGKRRGTASPSDRQVKILMLGIGSSGKTTIMKQMRIIHGGGFTEEELKEWIPRVYLNLFNCVIKLVKGARHLKFPISKSTEADEDLLVRHKHVTYLGGLAVRMIEAIKRIWADPAIIETYARRTEFQEEDDCASYLVGEIDRIGAPEYVPTVEDILKVRLQTTGIQEFKYTYKSTNFWVCDVPGQRSQRRKWLHCFDGIEAVLFVVAISEYDQQTADDKKTNRVQESLNVFDRCINHECLKDSHPIVFLNKTDLFEEKVQNVAIKDHFKDYKGPEKNAMKGLQFFEKEFRKTCLRSNERRMFVHKSTATNTTKFQPLLEAAADEVMARAFAAVGLM